MRRRAWLARQIAEAGVWMLGHLLPPELLIDVAPSDDAPPIIGLYQPSPYEAGCAAWVEQADQGLMLVNHVPCALPKGDVGRC